MSMNTLYRKSLPGSHLDYFDAREAVNTLSPGAYEKLPYTSRVLAEQLVRRCDPNTLTQSLEQIIERKRDLDFPWYPARVVCHDILGQTALVDLAGLRDAIAQQGGDPAKVNPVVETQLIVDHSLAVEHAGFDPETPLIKIGRLKSAEMKTVFILLSGVKPRLRMSALFLLVMASCTKSTWRKCLLLFRLSKVSRTQTPALVLIATHRMSML